MLNSKDGLSLPELDNYSKIYESVYGNGSWGDGDAAKLAAAIHIQHAKNSTTTDNKPITTLPNNNSLITSICLSFKLEKPQYFSRIFLAFSVHNIYIY